MKNTQKIQYGILDGSTLLTMTHIKDRAIRIAKVSGHQAVKLLPNGWMATLKNENIGLAWK
jgi:hypothetical protein